MKILGLVVIEEALSFDIPELNPVPHNVFSESIKVPVVFDQGVAIVDVLSNKLANSADSRQVNLPAVGYLSLVFSYCGYTFGKLDVIPVLSKKLVELLLRDDFTKAVDRSKGDAAAETGADQWENMSKDATHRSSHGGSALLLVKRSGGMFIDNPTFVFKLTG